MSILDSNIQQRWGDLFEVTLLYSAVKFVESTQHITVAEPGAHRVDHDVIFVPPKDIVLKSSPKFQQDTYAKRLFDFEATLIDDDLITNLSITVNAIFQSIYISLQEINPPAMLKNVIKCFTLHIPDPHIGDFILQGQPIIIFERKQHEQ